MTPGRSDAPGSAPRALAKTNPTEAQGSLYVDEIAADLGAAVDQLASVDLDRARVMLDAPGEYLEKLWARVNDLAEHRKIQPELRAGILRVAEQIDPALAEQLRHELDEATSAAVLEAHQDELIPDRPTLGAFPTSDRLTAPSIEDWLREDPTRLRGVTFEVARFTKDDRAVATSVLTLANALEIDLKLAGDVVAHALIDVHAARDHEGVAR